MSLQGDQKNKDKRLASKSTILGRFQICISYKKSVRIMLSVIYPKRIFFKRYTLELQKYEVAKEFKN